MTVDSVTGGGESQTKNTCILLRQRQRIKSLLNIRFMVCSFQGRATAAQPPVSTCSSMVGSTKNFEAQVLGILYTIHPTDGDTWVWVLHEEVSGGSGKLRACPFRVVALMT